MKKSKTKRRCPMLLCVLLRLALLGFALWTALVAFVCVKEYTVPKPDGTTQAIIVLGAQVKPDGTLSLQLQYRMELALEQYHAHPQVIVVCGAQGGNEPMTEAQAMHDYLVSNGVPEGDILMDDTSFNTRQNLTNAQKLLGDELAQCVNTDPPYGISLDGGGGNGKRQKQSSKLFHANILLNSRKIPGGRSLRARPVMQ